jgi:hypothetical protein
VLFSYTNIVVSTEGEIMDYKEQVTMNAEEEREAFEKEMEQIANAPIVEITLDEPVSEGYDR